MEKHTRFKQDLCTALLWSASGSTNTLEIDRDLFWTRRQVSRDKISIGAQTVWCGAQKTSALICLKIPISVRNIIRLLQPRFTNTVIFHLAENDYPLII